MKKIAFGNKNLHVNSLIFQRFRSVMDLLVDFFPLVVHDMQLELRQ